ncbi:MAG: UbiA family prenyltransferase [Betaproteobacteria bacterium]|nr:UbiA family prenyltransferase [Betaproteobacteria bacterium]
MLKRLWIYQRERFPLATMSALALLLGAAATMFSALLRGAAAPSALAVVAAAGSALLVFAQMRIFDEFKDFEDDARFRPYRAVPRGLVTLGELRWVLAVAAAGQIAIALAVDARLLWLLAALWGYHLLMAAEFFARAWLRSRHFAYLASHVPFGALIALYATAFEWLPRAAEPHPALLLLGAAALFDTVMLEIGRKIRAPRDEEVGVATYSAVWGRRRAAAAWMAAFVLVILSGGLAARAAGQATVFALLMAPLLAAAMVCSLRSLRRPGIAKAFDVTSILATFMLYAALGPIPYLLAS